MAAYIRRSSAGRRDPVPLLLPRLGELFREGERGIGGMRHLQEAAEREGRGRSVYLLKFAKGRKIWRRITQPASHFSHTSRQLFIFPYTTKETDWLTGQLLKL